MITENTIPEDALLLDKCTIVANPPLDLHVEHMTVPVDVMAQFNMKMESSETNSGLQITSKFCISKLLKYCLTYIGLLYLLGLRLPTNCLHAILSCAVLSNSFQVFHIFFLS